MNDDKRQDRVAITVFVAGPVDQYTECTTYIEPAEWRAMTAEQQHERVRRQAEAVIERLPQQPATGVDPAIFGLETTP